MDVLNIFKIAIGNLIEMPEIRALLKRNIVSRRGKGAGNEVRIYPYLNMKILEQLAFPAVRGLGYERIGEGTESTDCSIIFSDTKRYAFEIKGPTWDKAEVNKIANDIKKLQQFKANGLIEDGWAFGILLNDGKDPKPGVYDLAEIPISIMYLDLAETEHPSFSSILDLASA